MKMKMRGTTTVHLRHAHLLYNTSFMKMFNLLSTIAVISRNDDRIFLYIFFLLAQCESILENECTI